MESTTVKELAKFLRGFPKDTKVFISQDSEGNGFGTVDETAVDYSQDDGAIILFPVRDHLDYDEVFPLQWQKESKE